MDAPSQEAQPPGEHRISQRVSRRCTFCSRRKVRCDMKIPCSRCRARGQAGNCHIAPVVVKGRLVDNAVEELQPSYEELLAENQRLRQQSNAEFVPSHSQNARPGVLSPMYSIASAEHLLYSRLKAHRRPGSIIGTHDVFYPSDLCSTALLEHADRWSAWLHCAVDPVHFANQHQAYLSARRCNSPEGGFDPAWLAMYFASLSASLLFLTDEHAYSIGIPTHGGSIKPILLNWFDASVFFLHRADYMRAPDVRCVQAIAILGISFPNLGEFNLYYHLWSTALRSCQLLRIHTDDIQQETVDARACFSRRCIFWSLVVDDWLAANLGHTCINPSDFSVALPRDLMNDPGYGFGPHKQAPRPLQHFLCTIQISRALQRFHASLQALDMQRERVAVEAAVQRADNDLAQIISELPEELHPNMEHDQHIEDLTPQIVWQRRSVCIMLFYYRIVVYRVVRSLSTVDLPAYTTATAVCRSSAHGILRVMMQMEQEGEGAWARQSVWLRLLPLFSAAATLIECGAGGCCESETCHYDCVDRGTEIFTRLESRSIYASYAAAVLNELRAQ